MQEFELDIRIDPQGQKFIHFPFQTISDLHWSTDHCRAKKVCHMFEHTKTNSLFLVGDIVDGEYLATREKWKFPDWHRQGMGHIFRKIEEGTKVVYTPGNHDIDIREQTIDVAGKKKYHRNLCGKSIYGINFQERTYYTDDLGRKYLLVHGDKFDNTLGSLAGFGNAALEVMGKVDTWFQSLPYCGHISLAAKSKRFIKKIIDKVWSIRKHIAEEVDGDDSLHGIITGHSHMSELARTPKGKHQINDGCCTENVETLVMDKNGKIALLEWHDTYLKITEEMIDKTGKLHVQQRFMSWQALGLTSFLKPAKHYDDESTYKADRVIRLIYRMWPPLERKARRLAVDFARSIGEITESTAFIPVFHPKLERKLAQQRLIV